MTKFYLFPRWALRTGLLLAPAGAALAQAPVITSVIPMANAQAAARSGPVTVNFNQPLTAASAGALKVFSSQRGGLRSRGTTPAVVSGSTLSFAPTAYDFRPGETVQYTVTTAAASSGGALGRAQVGQFTAAVGGTGRGGFLISSDPAVNKQSSGVALGDIDGDGDLDMLTANSDDAAVAVLLNNGSGSFGGTAYVTVGDFPVDVITADVDADGDLDLLTTNSRDQTVSIRLNNGKGLFTGSQNVSVGINPSGLAVGDIDGDGDLDLLTTTANTVSVRLNDGNGIFSGTYNVSVGPMSQRVAVGDVDNDGDLDLLTANPYAGTVSVRLNNGNGLFSGSQEVSVGPYPFGMVVGDVDNDGDLDFATASDVINGSISIRLNDGNGNFSGTWDMNVGTFPSCIALGDVDNDGNLDILVATSYIGLLLTVYSGNGNGQFSNNQSIGVGVNPSSIALGDVDSDGDLDALVLSSTSLVPGSVSIRLNGGTGPLAVATSHPASTALALFPNPAHGAATLTGAVPNAPLTVLDALGRVLLTTTADATGTARLVLPAGLPAGVYLVRSGGQVRRLAVE